MSKDHLQDVLRLALSCQGDEGASGSEGARTMTEEDRKFVENALKSMTVDVVDLLRNALTVLNNADASIDDKATALNTIREQIDNLDFANSFIKIGGGRVLLTYMRHDNVLLRKLAIYIAAEMSQNNSYCQAFFLQNETLALLVNNLDDVEEIAISSLHAISALVSNNEKGASEFVRLNGIPKLLDCVETEYPRVFIKTCFLIDNLVKQSREAEEQLVNLEAFQTLFSHLEPVKQFDIKCETLLGAMATISESPYLSVPHNHIRAMKSLLDDIINENENLPECEEIVQYAQTVRDALDKCRIPGPLTTHQQLMLLD